MRQRRHERHAVVHAAELDLMELMLGWEKRHDLTSAEWGLLITAMLSRELGNHFKYEIRYERHGDYDTPGDIEAQEKEEKE